MHQPFGGEQILATPATIPAESNVAITHAVATVCLHTPFVNDRDSQRGDASHAECGRNSQLKRHKR